MSRGSHNGKKAHHSKIRQASFANSGTGSGAAGEKPFSLTFEVHRDRASCITDSLLRRHGCTPEQVQAVRSAKTVTVRFKTTEERGHAIAAFMSYGRSYAC